MLMLLASALQSTTTSPDTTTSVMTLGTEPPQVTGLQKDRIGLPTSVPHAPAGGVALASPVVALPPLDLTAPPELAPPALGPPSPFSPPRPAGFLVPAVPTV